MILVGIDIGKLSHMFCVLDSSTGEFLVHPVSFKNNKQGDYSAQVDQSFRLC